MDIKQITRFSQYGTNMSGPFNGSLAVRVLLRLTLPPLIKGLLLRKLITYPFVSIFVVFLGTLLLPTR